MSSIRSLTVRVKLIGLVLIISLITACNSDSNIKSDNNTELHKQIFLIGNGPNSMEITRELIDKSGIRKGGYVVIIPTSFDNNKLVARDLKSHFYFNEVTAVHILNIKSELEINTTDLLAIENARIICILDGNKNKFMKLANNSDLKKSLTSALNNGGLIAGKGNGASILGDYYFVQWKNSKTNESQLGVKPGLGLLKNTVIDKTAFLNNQKSKIKQKSSEKNFAFIGLDKNSALWINDTNAMVLTKSGVSFLKPSTPLRRFKYEEKFSLSIK